MYKFYGQKLHWMQRDKNISSPFGFATFCDVPQVISGEHLKHFNILTFKRLLAVVWNHSRARVRVVVIWAVAGQSHKHLHHSSASRARTHWENMLAKSHKNIDKLITIFDAKWIKWALKCLKLVH